MPRALTAEWSETPEGQRGAFIAVARARREALHASGCNYWVFENAAEPGTFLEFIEAPDAERLRAAHRRVGVSPAVAVLTEVELD